MQFAAKKTRKLKITKSKYDDILLGLQLIIPTGRYRYSKILKKTTVTKTRSKKNLLQSDLELCYAYLKKIKNGN